MCLLASEVTENVTVCVRICVCVCGESVYLVVFDLRLIYALFKCQRLDICLAINFRWHFCPRKWGDTSAAELQAAFPALGIRIIKIERPHGHSFVASLCCHRLCTAASPIPPYTLSPMPFTRPPPFHSQFFQKCLFFFVVFCFLLAASETKRAGAN